MIRNLVEAVLHGVSSSTKKREVILSSMANVYRDVHAQWYEKKSPYLPGREFAIFAHLFPSKF